MVSKQKFAQKSKKNSDKNSSKKNFFLKPKNILTKNFSQTPSFEFRKKIHFSKQFSQHFDKTFFHGEGKKILSEKQAMFFVVEELLLIALFFIQLALILGLDFSANGFALSSINLNAILSLNLTQNVLWLLATVFIFIIGYLSIGVRDSTVIFLHKNLDSMIWKQSKVKVAIMGKRFIGLIALYIIFALILSASIMVYLDPEINIIPYPFNFLFFILFLYFSWLTFQQNNLRSFINEYGTKGLFEPRKRVGKLMAFRATETKHKFIHIRHSHFHKKNFLNLNWATRNVNNNSSGLSYKGSQKVIVKKKTKF